MKCCVISGRTRYFSRFFLPRIKKQSMKCSTKLIMSVTCDKIRDCNTELCSWVKIPKRLKLYFEAKDPKKLNDLRKGSPLTWQ